MNIRYSHIQENSLVDGPGKRTVLFLQGCQIHCPGCQNKKLWDLDGGSEADVIKAAAVLASIATNKQVTISGGEPFQQAQALAQLVLLLKVVYHLHVIVYTGYTWDYLNRDNNDQQLYAKVALANIDVLVDGPYFRRLDDDTIIYRGSRNQHPIDVKASRKDINHPVVLNWDQPEVVIDGSGNIFLPIGLTEMGAEIGDVKHTRMCGQTRGLK